MPSDRKYYRTIIKVEVLSEDPVDFDSLQDVHHAITTGDCSGEWRVTKTEKVDGPKMAKLLQKQGSDPSFFMLDDEGNKIDNSGSEP